MMNDYLKLFHLVAAVVWMGGMAVMIFAVRPGAMTLLEPPQRLPLMAAVLQKFFLMVWISIAVLLITGLAMYGFGSSAAVAARKAAGLGAGSGPLMPLGWNVMLGIGTAMFLVFGHIYFASFKKLKAAVAVADWPSAGAAMAKIHPKIVLNFGLGWAAIAAVRLLS